MGAKKRSFNVGLIRRGANYSMQEIAALFHMHVNSIRLWIKQGLKLIDKQKPYLVHGSDLIYFLKEKQQRRKVKCKKHQMYCCYCRVARQTTNNLANIEILNDTQLLIFGNCQSCRTKICRIGTVNKLHVLKTIFSIQKIHDRRLVDSAPPIINVDIKKD